MGMTSLERMFAALRGQPFDRYPVINVSPNWSLMPHWPALTGLNFLHVSYGSDEERMRCFEVLRDALGLDWMPVGGGVSFSSRGRYRVDEEDGVPIVVDTAARSKTRYHEFPKDLPPKEPLFDTAEQVERLPAVPTAEELLASGEHDFTRRLVERFGEEVFLLTGGTAPFPHCFNTLGHERLFEAMRDQPDLLFALMERQTEVMRQRARLARMLGLHCVSVMEFFCSADLISEKDFARFAFPYEERVVRAIKDEGLVVAMNLMGWIEPRLVYLARLGLDCLQVEAGLKGYTNDLVKCRQALGEEVCLCGNAHAVWVIERGDEDVWRRDALEQAKAVGQQRRYAIGSGTPLTWATTPERFRRFVEYTRSVVAEAAPPLPFAGR